MVLVIDLPSTPVPQPHRAVAQAVPVSHLYRLFSSSLTLEAQMCDSARLYHCARCQRQVIICRYCDRGNIYCAAGCALQSREEKQREAAQRYQFSLNGRRSHALRQQHYRQRQREKVTHQGSPNLTAYDLLITEPETVTSRRKFPFLKKSGDIFCHFCGFRCGEYLRISFLHQQSHCL